MAEASVVGSTRVSVIPDLSGFGDRLRIELPAAIRQPAETAGDLAGERIRQAISKKLAKPIGVKVKAALDDKAAVTALQKLTKDRTVRITAELDDKAAVASLTRLTADRKVTITADVDDTAAKATLGTLSGQHTVDVLPKIQQAALRQAERQLDRLTADRTVNIRASVDTRVGAQEIRNLIQRRQVRIGVDVDTRVGADSLANLTRRRTMTVQARADTTAANTALNHLARDRNVNVRIRSTGLGALTANLGNLGSSSSGSGGGVGMLSTRVIALAGAALGALPTVAALGQAIVQMGPAAAVAAPAITALLGTFAAIKVGTTGVGDAIKAAFQPAAGEAKAAATATRQVETAQRQLARAQQGVAQAERSLTQAQRTARQAQDELNGARRQAARDLEDMNARLRQGALDQEQAALDVRQAETDLAAVRADPTATQLQIQQAELALERSRAAAQEQTRQQKRLTADTAAANKAGVEGSDQVVQAKERIRQANEQVRDQERQLADAHRAVADAARQVAEAQQMATAQTSKLDQAMAKLSPNARGFVNTLRAMGPAWRDMRLEVQDRLFAGLGTRLQQVGAQILPTVRSGLAGTAGQLNLMGKSALTAVSNLQRAGQLRQVFDGIQSSLGNLRRIPGQFVTALGQVSIAARPAFDRITSGAASVVDRVMAKLSVSLNNGRLADAINTALDIAVQFGHVLADAGAILKNVFAAAADGGGNALGVIGDVLGEIRRITEMPEVKAALTTIFSAIQSIAALIAGTLGAVIQAVLPVLAALAPTITALAQSLGPVLAQLATSLGEALMPVITALTPIISLVGNALIQIVQALTPLLKPIGDLIGQILTALTPILGPILDVVVQLVQQLAGPLTTVITSLTPAIQLIGTLFTGVFAALMPALTPIIGVIGQLAGLVAGVFAQAVRVLVALLAPLIPVVVSIVSILGQLLAAVMKPLTPVIKQVATLLGQALGLVMKALAPVIATLVTSFAQILPALLPLMPAIVELIAALAQLIPPLLQLALAVITPLLPLITRLANLITRVLVAALLQILPPVVQVITWLVKLAAAAVKSVTTLVEAFTGLSKKTIAIFKGLKDGSTKVWNSLWSTVRSTATDTFKAVRAGFETFGSQLTKAFRSIRDEIGDIWAGLKNLVKAPVKFWIETVYNKGIVSVWNSTAGKIPGVPDLKPMAMPRGFARGGILPGWSTWRDGDDQLVPMRRGEGVYVSEVMRDPYERARLHALNSAAIRGQHPSAARAQFGFSGGGILGDIGSGIKHIGSSVADGVGSVLKKGAGIVRGGLADLAQKAFSPVRKGITKALGANTGTWPGMVGAAPLNLIDKAIGYIRGKDIPDSTGAWTKPVNVPYGTRFGVKGRMWSSGRHTGLDFPARTGTRVGAVDNGTIKAATSGGPYGKHVTVDHGHGLTSLYAHMSAIAAKVGAGIKQGARIGAVGATGNVTGPHLHLEARINGKAVDPMKYLGGGSGDGGHGVQRWRGVVQQALGQVHQSLGLVNTTLRRMNQESGGNPTAVNRTDSNWKAGTPSVGLMQVIKGTFRAYAGKFKNTGPFMYGVSTDPLANVYASMRYALDRYGSLSRAYNRPGGYAMGGLVGGTRIHTGRSGGGYASGGIIKVRGKRIDTGPVAASVGSDFLKQLTATASTISAAMAKVATAVRNAFKGVRTDLDNKLLARIGATNKQLQALATSRDRIAAKIAAANAFATEATGSASQFAQLTSLPNGGNTFDASGILHGLSTRLSQIRQFGANIKTLAARGLSKALLQQIIAAGPDSGAAYAKALVDATPAQLKQINSVQSQITKASTQYGQTAADVMYDAGAQSGKGYLAGLKAQEKSISNAMSALAKKIQKVIRAALQIKSPSRVFAALGRYTVQGFARGMHAATPHAAAAAARMATVVRATAAAATTRIENTNSTTTVGDRHLHYNATVREQASRRSILDALAVDDLLHRPVVSGG